MRVVCCANVDFFFGFVVIFDDWKLTQNLGKLILRQARRLFGILIKNIDGTFVFCTNDKKK